MIAAGMSAFFRAGYPKVTKLMRGGWLPGLHAIIIAITLTAAAGSAGAAPALWVVKDKGSTVYLLGTVHAVSLDQTWRTPLLDRAFAESDDLWLETPLPVTATGSASAFAPEEAQRIRQMTIALGISSGPPLRSRLSDAEAAELARYAAIVPIPMATVDQMRPWMAANTVGVALLKELGLSSVVGADVILQRDAIAAGKPVKAFETLEQQLHFFADLSPEDELGYLRQALAEASAGKPRFAELERLWLAGDDANLTKIAIDPMRTRSPLLYGRFVADRNRTWMRRIRVLLGTPGVHFIAVGNGHLVGPDGLLALLQSGGQHVERVQ